MQHPRQDTFGLQMPPCLRPDNLQADPLSGPVNLQPATPPALLSWPASFREYQSPRVRSAPKQTCQFERLATFRTRRHPPRELQSVGRAAIPIKPVDQVLRRFFAHRSVELPAVRTCWRPHPARLQFEWCLFPVSHGTELRAAKNNSPCLSRSRLPEALPIVVVNAGIGYSRKTGSRVI
jgi:hypothetical protein